jgi:LmbE family N-acetylglucosaminyl deacetylase
MLPFALKSPGAKPLRLLFLGAHCDDVEIGCGGTILRLAEEHPEASFTWVTFASTPERKREAETSASRFLEGVKEHRVEVNAFRESYFPFVGAELKDHFETLKRHAPDVVFTHAREDRHQDHRIVSDLTWNTFRDHLVLEYEIPKWDGDLGQPNCFVPLARETVQRKARLLLECFPSQATRSWFTADTFTSLARLRGIECNAPEGHAEAFTLRKAVL